MERSILSSFHLTLPGALVHVEVSIRFFPIYCAVLARIWTCESHQPSMDSFFGDRIDRSICSSLDSFYFRNHLLLDTLASSSRPIFGYAYVLQLSPSVGLVQQLGRPASVMKRCSLPTTSLSGVLTITLKYPGLRWSLSLSTVCYATNHSSCIWPVDWTVSAQLSLAIVIRSTIAIARWISIHSKSPYRLR